MKSDWIIDVLTDIRRFARDNELPLLAAQLEEVALVAQLEIAAQDADLPLAPCHDPDLHITHDQTAIGGRRN